MTTACCPRPFSITSPIHESPQRTQSHRMWVSRNLSRQCVLACVSTHEHSAHEEAEDQAVEALRLVELHPMASAFEALITPRSRDAGSGAQHLRFCKVRIP